MGCFLGCFGDAKDHKRRKQRTKRASPRLQRNRVEDIQQEGVSSAEPIITETTHTNLVSELQSKPSGEEQLSASPKKKVTFNSNITKYEHVSVQENIDSLPQCNGNVGREKQDDLKRASSSHSVSEDDNSVISSAGSYPPNHRYHNARESDDEAEEYGGSDLDDFDDLDEDDDEEDEYGDYDEEHSDGKIPDQEMESRIWPPNEEVSVFGTNGNARDRNGYVNSVLNPIENITQWKAAKSRGTHQLKPQEKSTPNSEAPHISFSPEPTIKQKSVRSKFDQQKKENQEIAVDASLSKWLVTPGKTMSQGSTTPGRSFEDRPILGALTVEELRQISATSTPRKSPSRSPDEMPIIGSVGTYWNDSASTMYHNSASSCKGISKQNQHRRYA